MVKPTSQTPSSEGLPEITEPAGKKRVLLVILGGLLLLLVTHFYFNAKKTTPKSEFSVEESYTTPSTQPEKPKEKSYSTETKPLSEQQLALLEEKQKELQQRLAAPMMTFNQNQASNDHSHTVKSDKTVNAGEMDANRQFLQQASTASNQRVKATKMGSLNQLIAEGHMIHAILETAINSDLPGNLRATIDQPVYAEDGSQILIPPGSRLIGQYKSGMLQGQSRVFVVWTRLMTPDGISLNLASPGVDSLGMAGMSADTINHHFWQQFGTTALLSILGVGTSNVGVDSNASYNASQAYRMAIANSFNQTAQQTLQAGMIPPTLWVNQGSPIQVFVAHDLDFSAVNKTAHSKMNIF
ncbi:TrbI/VirB10 family protein [Rickettsiella endosymbiont of Dermanyssus gallinae]|uniref:TrbI/VirB10 family protein n=1 Tax=Rickettsiella endosymbiont of Dermanyssus gallinae TaxID=2856608 RepID=UPI001C530B1A|nr:TrbI/VirB10 family protein [Rickettsiella endosymbiont of Dermanyssus gallinae]